HCRLIRCSTAEGGLTTMPQRLSQYLLDQPETTNDLHVVSVILKDGRVFEDVAISHCSLVAAVRGHSHVPFDAKDVAELRVTHRRWGFGQQAKPSSLLARHLRHADR